MIVFDGVKKSYGNKTVLDGFNLKVERGEFLTIIGNSGGGKTTILKLINGLLKPDGGTVLVRGEDISKVDIIALRRNIGYVIQSIGLFPHMNIMRNINYVPSLKGRQDKRSAEQSARRLLDLVGLESELLLRYPSELSGGQQQRVGIARALAASPDIILMDEPFGAVDEITRKMLQNQIIRIHEELGVTIVFVTHDIREALLLGTRVLVMNDGKIEQLAPPKELRERPATPFVAELIGNSAHDGD